MWKKKENQKDNRFEIVLREDIDGLSECQILKDTQTGVLYCFYQSMSLGGLTGGLTPLLDKDGKPLLDMNEKKELTHK